MSILTDFSHAIDVRMPLAGKAILDVGSGDGAFVRELSRAGARLTGLECSVAQLALCHEATRVGSEQYVSGVGQSLPFPDDSFDATVFRSSLHHVPAAEMLTALMEARRVTRPEGEIFVFEPLTSGTHFEMTRLVDDETVVRGQAQQAIAEAVKQGLLTRRHEATMVAEVVYDSVDALRRRILAIDDSRSDLFDGARAELERVFAARGVAQSGGGRLFHQPFRLDVLA